jgi:Cu+-exporting ATPase
MSIMVDIDKGATAAVLMKNAEAPEYFEKIDPLVADKTGALTEGKSRVVDVVPAEGFDEALFYPSEPASNDPASIAVIASAKHRGVEVKDVSDCGSL